MSATDTLAVTMGTSYTGDLNADLAANSIPPLQLGTYTVIGYTTDNTAAICDVTGTAFTLNVLASSDPACSGTACDAGDVLSTLDGQTFDYCPGTSVDLITDGTEVIPTGELYAWVFINATDTAIIMAGPNYSGDINAFLVANSQPPIPYGTYLVYGIVSSGGQTLVCDETPGDFYINVLQSSDPACAPPCSIDAITVGTQSACNPTTNTYTQDITFTYSNAPTGTINVNGQTFAVTSSPQTITLSNLSANGSAVSINAFFTNNTSCSFTQSNAFTAPAACNATSCIITAISAGTQTACDPATNTYTQQITVTYNNAPTGTLNVNGQTFAVTSSPQTVTLTNLTANGTAVNVTAFFTNNTSCTFTQNNAFTAPANCTPPPSCSAGDIDPSIAGTAIDYCPNTSISFSSDGNEVIPTGGGYGFVFMSATDTVAITMGTSYTGDLNADLAANSIPPLVAGVYTVIGFTSDDTAAICDVTATSFTLNVLTASDPACQSTPTCDAGDVVSTLNGQTFNYCPGTDVDLITDGTETIPSGEVYAWVFINATDTAIIPVGANYSGDINALLAANSLPTIPYGTYTVYGIVTTSGQTAICDETPGDFIVNVLQSSDPACQSPCAITAVTGGAQTACDPATNTYTQQITITYNNAPTGTLNVNGQTFAVTSSPQTVTLTNLTADGNAVDVTAFFSNAANCNFSSTALFTAPAACAVVPCAISNVSVGNQSACDTSTNTYTQTVTLTYSNAPTGTINVNGQVFNQTSSPQTVTLTGLVADGSAVAINAFFTNDASCSYTSSNAFVAPANCTGGSGVLDTLVVMMIPNGSGTIYVENDIITSTPFTGYYAPNSMININVTTFTNNTFDFWKLNNLSLIDYSPSTQFAFINQDTLFAYFNGAMSIQALDDAFSSFKAYPTFVNNEITFEFETNKNVPLTIDLYSIDGKKLTTFFNEEVQANTVYKKNCSVGVAGGMYFLKIATDKHSISQKIIKY
ncbi:MAG: T9SS type A sorting domain-containing protein [Chitinophagales bacterium]